MKQTINDWQNTLDLASPDYYPEGLLAKSKPKQKAHIKEIDGNWGKINTALNSDASVFGKIANNRIKLVKDASDMTEVTKNIQDTDAWKEVEYSWGE